MAELEEHILGQEAAMAVLAVISLGAAVQAVILEQVVPVPQVPPPQVQVVAAVAAEPAQIAKQVAVA